MPFTRFTSQGPRATANRRKAVKHLVASHKAEQASKHALRSGTADAHKTAQKAHVAAARAHEATDSQSKAGFYHRSTAAAHGRQAVAASNASNKGAQEAYRNAANKAHSATTKANASGSAEHHKQASEAHHRASIDAKKAGDLSAEDHHRSMSHQHGSQARMAAGGRHAGDGSWRPDTRPRPIKHLSPARQHVRLRRLQGAGTHARAFGPGQRHGPDGKFV